MDSGAQPSPHYCEHPPAGKWVGCPAWPACLALPHHWPEDGAPDDEPGARESLAGLAAFAGWCVVFLIVAAALLPFVI